jgi:hypothetical protein
MTMMISANQSIAVGKLLHVMAEGEYLARDCARRQAISARNRRLKRFFSAQARHEQFHASLFLGAARRLAPDSAPQPEYKNGLTLYARSLDVAMSANRWDEVVIGQQLVLEGLGELVLQRLDREMSRRGLGFARTRCIVLKQERAHHHFGERWVKERLGSGQLSVIRAREVVEQFIGLADVVLADIAELLDGLETDPNSFRQAFHQRLPGWAIGGIP